MKKNISSEFAIGLILLITLTIGGIFWLNEQREDVGADLNQNIAAANPEIASKEALSNVADSEKDISCKPHYYDGEAQVHAWISEKSVDMKKIKVEIKKEDLTKLPNVVDAEGSHFVAILVDADSKTSKDLQKATQENPVLISVHGFANVCQSFPQISLDQASIAFKKS